MREESACPAGLPACPVGGRTVSFAMAPARSARILCQEALPRSHLPFPRREGDVASFRVPRPAAETNGLRRTSPGPPPPVFLPGANLSFTEKHPVNNELGGVL